MPTETPAAADAPVELTNAPAPAAPKAAAPTEQPQAKKKKSAGVPPRRGKKLRNQLKTIDKKVADAGTVSLKQGVALLRQLKRAKFDETVEIHINLGIDPTQSDQMVRGSVGLPHGTGKSVRVAVFCQGDKVALAKGAGADHVGGADLVEKITKEGFMDFDVAIATQDMMAQVSRLGKVLGPRGLMPTPKAGTVIPLGQDVMQAVKEQKAGKVEFRADKGGNVHAGVGKLSFEDKKLIENIQAFIDQIRSVKPTGVKGNYVKSIFLSATMCPGVPVSQ